MTNAFIIIIYILLFVPLITYAVYNVWYPKCQECNLRIKKSFKISVGDNEYMCRSCFEKWAKKHMVGW